MGWQAGLAICTIAIAVVTALNTTFLFVAIPRLDRPNGDTEGALFTGECKIAKQYSIWLHLAINILGTVLLASGNYTQQVLTAPTRDEIDAAHGQGQWLDVGIMSFRNLRMVSGKRVFIWTIMALSSLPIHVLYNSVISFETGVNTYSVYATKWETLDDPKSKFADEDFQSLKKSLDEFEKLENRECITTYGQKLVSGRSDVILILDPDRSDKFGNYTDVLGGRGNPMNDPYNWICEFDNSYTAVCDVNTALRNPDSWFITTTHYLHGTKTDRAQVKYCLSKRVDEHCRLILSIPMLGIVIGCNAFKLLGMLLTWLCLDKRPLLTLGDVMTSFLDNPDPITKDMPFLSKRSGWRLSWETGPKCWSPTRRFWAGSVSWARYNITVALCLGVLGAAGYLLNMAIENLIIDDKPTLADLWNRGFGQVNVDSMLGIGVPGAMGQVLISNSPQLIASLLYAALNGLWTAMLVGVEWNSYGLKRKGLRTTYPVGQQRRTYWLSLPLRYGIPLIIGSATLHWLISQSIFFVRLVVYRDDDIATGPDGSPRVFITCGYSAIAIIFSITLGSLILLVSIGGSLRRMTTAIPAVGTCSAVVSAACHRPEADALASWGTVKWGVVCGRNEWRGRHCCLTSWRVKAPDPEQWYN